MLVKIETINKITCEVIEKPLYVFKPDNLGENNLGENMSIDDKAIGHNGFTV